MYLMVIPQASPEKLVIKNPKDIKDVKIKESLSLGVQDTSLELVVSKGSAEGTNEQCDLY